VKSVVHVEKSRCAFINFKERKDAERAAEAWASGVDIDGTRANVKWGRSRGAVAGAAPAASASGGSGMASAMVAAKD
jgi:pre-mRNA-splicing factor RBM22/SLT11